MCTPTRNLRTSCLAGSEEGSSLTAADHFKQMWLPGGYKCCGQQNLISQAGYSRQKEQHRKKCNVQTFWSLLVQCRADSCLEGDYIDSRTAPQQSIGVRTSDLKVTGQLDGLS